MAHRRQRGRGRVVWRLLAAALAALLLPLPALGASAPAPRPPYADVPADFWDAGRVVAAVRAGFLSPYGRDFRPTWAVTEADLVHALSRLPGGPGPGAALALVAGAERVAGAAYAPQGTVTHAVFALALVDALGLGGAAADFASVGAAWPDSRAIPRWASGAATLMARLGLTWGNTWAGTFQPAGGVERDQAAWVLVGAAHLTRAAVAAALAPAVAGVRAGGVPTALVRGQRVALHAVVVDRAGRPLPVGVVWRATGAVAVDGSTVLVAVAPGWGEVTARALAGGAQATWRVAVRAGPAAPWPRAAGSAVGPFPDVPATAWEAAAVRQAAARGLMPPLAGSEWSPAAPLHEAGLAHALGVWKGVGDAGGASLVRAALGAYAPDARVDHAQLAEAIDVALGLGTVAADEAALAPTFADEGALPPAERGAVTLFGHLGLGLGDLPPGRFAPAAIVTRAQAAYALVGATALSEAALGREASRVVRTVTVPTPARTPVQVGVAVAFTARALDAAGRQVPSALVWSATGGTVSASGVFLAASAGTAAVTAAAPLSGAHATARVAVVPPPPPPPVGLSVRAPASAMVGQPLTVRVTADGPGGVDAADAGRTIALAVTGPGGTTTLTAVDAGGVAVFSYTPTAPGTYTFSASSQGLSGASATTAVSAASGGASRLAVTAITPASPQEGAAVTLTVAVEDATGATVTGDAGRTLTLTLTQTKSALPTAAASPPAPVVLTAADQGGVATFTWTAGLPGTYSLTATAQGLSGAQATLTVAPAPPAGLVLSAPSPYVLAGSTVPITATVVDAGGEPTVGTLPLQVGLGAMSPGQLSGVAATVTDSGVVAEYTAPTAAGATAVVIAASPGLPPAQITLQVVSALPQDVPSFAAAPYSATAGQTVDVTVDVGPAGGAPDSASNGVPVTLAVAPVGGGATQTLTAADAAGVATFPLTEDAAGTYALTATIPGQAPAHTTLTVQPAAPAALALSAAPTSLLLPGQSVTLSVTVADAYGNLEPAGAAVPVTVALRPAGAGSLSVLSGQAPGAVARFTAQEPGTVVVTALSPGLRPAALQLTVERTRASLVAGKGMWLMWADWHNVGAASIVSTCVADHIDHLYLEVATTHDGFYGTDALDALLPLAHAAHIAVVAWVYTALVHPAQDAAMTVRVAQYTSPTGDRVDGVAADIEDVITSQAVTAYADAVRQALPGELFVGVTFPPMFHSAYPYAALAKDVDVIAPMDYWHSMPKAYTASYVYSYIRESIDEIRRLDGNPALPIAPIGEAYDMFTQSGTGPNNPTPAEILAAFAAAEDDGAIGFSLYRWGTATAAEWRAWAALVWGQPVPQGGGS
ncbi:MAG: hypothetical protein K6V73_04815 [Firmicutes bacterium]|nr:hypothetical protein [Bacillota bacterium]